MISVWYPLNFISFSQTIVILMGCYTTYNDLKWNKWMRLILPIQDDPQLFCGSTKRSKSSLEFSFNELLQFAWHAVVSIDTKYIWNIMKWKPRLSDNSFCYYRLVSGTKTYIRLFAYSLEKMWVMLRNFLAWLYQ